MSWEQNISNQLQNAQNMAVRFDIEQQLTTAQKRTARNNIGNTITATNTYGDDFTIAFNY